MHHLRALTTSFSSLANNVSGSSQSTSTTGREYRIRDMSYVEEKLLSEGGFGFVYLVRERLSNKPFVVKRILCQDSERYDLAMREVELFEKLPVHPNLVRYFGYTIEKDGRYKEVIILMEFCPGGHVYDLMKKYATTHVPLNIVLKVITDVVTGLHVLHTGTSTVPVQHRDLKLENVLCSSAGSYVLLDFGSWSSDSCDDTSALPRETFLKFTENIERYTTLMYRPPEMADLYKGFELSTKVDIWMLGCILFAIMNFKHPFQDASNLAIVNCRFSMDLKKVTSVYPISLVELCYWLLSQNPKDRPSTKELLAVLGSGCCEGKDTSPPLPLPKAVKDRLEKDFKMAGMKWCDKELTSDVWTKFAPPTEQVVDTSNCEWKACFENLVNIDLVSESAVTNSGLGAKRGSAKGSVASFSEPPDLLG